MLIYFSFLQNKVRPEEGGGENAEPERCAYCTACESLVPREEGWGWERQPLPDHISEQNM